MREHELECLVIAKWIFSDLPTLFISSNLTGILQGRLFAGEVYAIVEMECPFQLIRTSQLFAPGSNDSPEAASLAIPFGNFLSIANRWQTF